MIIKIICAGEDNLSSVYVKDPNEFIIGVDKGMDMALDAGLHIDLGLGDFDSTKSEKIIADEIKKYPPKKDESDLELAILVVKNKFKKKDIEKIEIYNGTGGRLDHFLAIIKVMERYYKLPIYLYDKNNEIYIISKNTIFRKNIYKYISFFALEEAVITLSGFKYDLNEYDLKVNDALCLSNEVINKAKIITNKKILVIRSNDAYN